MFSILIPSWNNLDLLKLCVRSIQQNSSHSHQIIIHVNDGSDGTLEWVRTQQIDLRTWGFALQSMRRPCMPSWITYFI
jgi:glycosyltransferase involved in cell wall biosynthesis